MKLPFVFRAEFAESLHKPLSGAGPVHCIKEAAGRERDLIDLRELRLFHEPRRARGIIHRLEVDNLEG